MTTETVVNITALSKSYDQQCVVDAIDLEVRRGECFGLLGPNGAGKTTTLRMMLGMTPADSGELKILGQSISQHAQAVRQHIGVVPQMDNLDPDFSVKENLLTYASYFNLSGKPVEQRIQKLLELARLTQKANEQIENLSGGMKRRLTLARALVNDPELLILDEPTTGLDPQARQLIWQRLLELKRLGHTLILTTHYMEEAERLCDRLAIMDYGRIIVEGSPQALIETHIEPHVIEVTANGVPNLLEQWECNDRTRVEKLGDSLFIYTYDEKPVIENLCLFPKLQFIHRRANLEDVFLKMTGRDLREE